MSEANGSVPSMRFLGGAAEININDLVRFRFTPYGRDMMRRRHYSQDVPVFLKRAYSEPKEDADGWVEMQLWEFMQTFGGEMHNGNPRLPIETTIQIVNRNTDLQGCHS